MKYEIGTRIKRIREEKGLSQKDFAMQIGVSNSRVSNWEQGINRPDADIIAAICRVLEVSADVLLDTKDAERGNGTDISSLPGILPLPHTVKKPLLDDIACGTSILAGENIEDMVDIPADVRCDFVLRCKDDSMIGARIHDGDVVYIRQQPEVENGQIAAVLLDGTETTLKRFYHTDGIVTLMAENPACAPIVVTEERQFSVIGKAVGFTSWIR